jgi:hypothetical protein
MGFISGDAWGRTKRAIQESSFLKRDKKEYDEQGNVVDPSLENPPVPDASNVTETDVPTVESVPVPGSEEEAA